MEDYMADLERKGIPFESDARRKKSGTVPLSGATRSSNRHAGKSVVLGSPEYLDGLKKNAQLLSSSSMKMKKSKAGSGELGRNGTKFEFLGSTPYSQGDAPKSGSQKSASQSSTKTTNARGSGGGRAAESSHNGHKKSVDTALAGKSNVTRNGRAKVISSSDEDSSDELNIARSSQPIETRANKHSRAVLKAIEVSDSDPESDDALWQRKMHTGLKGARVPAPARTTSKNLNKTVMQSKSKAQNVENSLFDEIPIAKKTKVKPRPVYKSKSKESKADSLLASLDSAVGPSSAIRLSKGSKYSDPLSSDRLSGNKQNEAKVQKNQVKHTSSNISIKGKLKITPAPFPILPGSSSPETRWQSERRSGNQKARDIEIDDSDSDEDEDPLCSNANDEIINRGGLRPFPMPSSPARSDSSLKPPSTSTMSSSTKRGSGSDDDRGPAKRRRGSNGMLIFDPINEMPFTQTTDRPDPTTLCPYCDMPFPANPSPLLLNMLERIPKFRDVRPSNPLGLKAPLLSYLSMCQRHQFETQLYPTALKEGWPTLINFAELPARVGRMRKHLTRILMNKEISLFWGEIQKDIDIKGVRKAMGIAGQFNSFDKSQPGYYGEQGAVIISQTLRTMFPLEDIDVDRIAPLTPSEFVQRVLVPECAVALIREDSGSGTTLEDALCTLRESSRYGTAMFPDLDNRDGISIVEGSGDGQKIGEAIVKERVRTRRMKIDEEEREEEELEKARSAESNGRRVRKGGLGSLNDIDHSPLPSQKEKTSKKKAISKKGTLSGSKEEDVISLSDSSSKQTDTSSTSRMQIRGKNKSSKGADRKPATSKMENLTLSRETHQVAKTVKPRPRFAARAAAGLDHILSPEEEMDNKITDETTPKPPIRVRAIKPELRSAALTSKTTDYKRTISNYKTKPGGSMQPLQAARARNTARKEKQFVTNMRENNASDLDETDKSSSKPSSLNSRKREQSSAWLLSDGSTPNSTPPF